ncbi:MAG TPA: SUMF1/EgtB/PvdO family nonheme iron enzyme [Rhabdochlamydiaceae bacterium]|nr:SUMF1/EgtB/PvdO family nonheme iron enzyme [Rhabdochlamydiaceae bacterium]
MGGPQFPPRLPPSFRHLSESHREAIHQKIEIVKATFSKLINVLSFLPSGHYRIETRWNRNTDNLTLIVHQFEEEWEHRGQPYRDFEEELRHQREPPPQRSARESHEQEQPPPSVVEPEPEPEIVRGSRAGPIPSPTPSQPKQEEGQPRQAERQPRAGGALSRDQTTIPPSQPSSKQGASVPLSDKGGFSPQAQVFFAERVKLTQQIIGFKASFEKENQISNTKREPLSLGALLIEAGDLHQEALNLQGQLKNQKKSKLSQSASKIASELKAIEKQLIKDLALSGKMSKDALIVPSKELIDTLNQLQTKIAELKKETQQQESITGQPGRGIPPQKPSLSAQQALNPSKAAFPEKEAQATVQTQFQSVQKGVPPSEQQPVFSVAAAIAGRTEQTQPTTPSLTLSLPIPAKTIPDIELKLQSFQNKIPVFPVMFSLPFPGALKTEKGSKKIKGKKVEEEQESLEDEEGEGGGAQRIQNFAWIPEGVAILGDPFLEGREDELPTRIVKLNQFLIATTPVTNTQFAIWLNYLLINERIKMGKKGQIIDLSGTLIGKTTESEPLSYIQLGTNFEGNLRFKPVSGKGNHPVVFVSHDGAELFCKDNGGRLPKEEEWEKAAGMQVGSTKETLRKFRYGFSEDIIDVTMANFAEGYSQELRKMNLTQPVGFYNGVTVFVKAGKQVKTQNALSQYGCYDMSGNVREWVSNWYGDEQTHKITKGGSYDSPAFDLRVAAKTSLYPDTCDPYTGFRIAFDIS